VHAVVRSVNLAGGAGSYGGGGFSYPSLRGMTEKLVFSTGIELSLFVVQGLGDVPPHD
jgi:hypothetical protein